MDDTDPDSPGASLPTLAQIRALVAVSERGSFRAAARALGVAQPTLTKAMQALEAELGVSLFARGARGTTPTPFGQSYARRASAVVNELRRAEEEVAQMRGEAGGSVAFGISAGAALALLSPVVEGFGRSHPAVRLRIVSGATPVALPLLRDGSIDFVVGPALDAGGHEDIASEVLFPNTRAIVCRRGHPRAEARDLGELLDQRWIAFVATGTLESEFAPLFASRGLRLPDRIVHCETAVAALAMLVGTDAMALVPRQYLDLAAAGGLTVRVPIEGVPGRDICLMTRRGGAPTPAAGHLGDLFRRAAAPHRAAASSRSSAPR